jgi:nucleoside triphosphate pyrophosphatase
MAPSNKLILASASPRRRQLLSEAGLAFECIESGFEEIRESQERGREYALRMAQAKALAVSRRIPDAIVIGADTIVECDGEILEKPLDPADARRMLNALSGRAHTVVTAFAIALDGEILEIEAVESRVFFRPLAETEIGEYIETGEPFDKAGAYGIQGVGGGFISKVEGPRNNVMGLPVEYVLAALARRGAL